MFKVKDSVHIKAPVERVFLLSTSVEVVRLTLGLRPVGGSRTAGLVVAGDTVEWRGWKFGLPQVHVSVISGYRASEFFQDTQLRGRFAAFQHDHHFFLETEAGAKERTRLEDELRFSMPLGWAGEMAGRVVMVPHIQGLLRRRFALLKRLAEGEGWREYLERDETFRAGHG